MESLFNYITEEQIIFNFLFDIIKPNGIKITIQEINKDNTTTTNPYISVYNLDFLNDRLGKFIHFNTIQDFRECLIENLSKKTLVVKPPYKSAIVTTWKIFPKDTKKLSTFTLISSSNYDKGLSLIFFGENKNSKLLIKEIETILQKTNPFENNEKIYIEYVYNDRLINNMVILPEEKKSYQFLQIL